MQIVIEIPKGTYDLIKHNVQATSAYQSAYYAIRNGIPLPKGHGRVIAEPTEEDIEKTIGGQNDFADCIREAVKAVFDNAPTIIEADKEGAEE